MAGGSGRPRSHPVTSFPYPPGENPGREEYLPDRYLPHQEILYRAFNLAYYGTVEGWSRCLHHSPGFRYDAKDFHKWRERFVAASSQESSSRGKDVTRGIEVGDLTEDVWLWVYERVLEARMLMEDHRRGQVQVQGVYED